MSKYFIVEKVNLEPATIKRFLGAKFKSNWHISWALISNTEELPIKLVEQLISQIITVLIIFFELHLSSTPFVSNNSYLLFMSVKGSCTNKYKY